MKNIPLVKPYIAPREEMLPAVEEILYSGYIAVGEAVDRFEEQFGKYVENPNVLSLNSGTAALHIALMLLGVGPGDEVLDGLVQGVAHVQGAVGEGRAVVEGEAGLVRVLLQQLSVDVQLLPALEHLRLPLGQTGPHGEVGFRQVDGCVVILRHG